MHGSGRGVRPSRAPFLVAALAAVILVPGVAAGRQAVLPTLYVAYTMNCTFSISDDSGRRVSAIPPGTYQVLVTTPVVFADVDLSGQAPNDFTACKSYVQFQLSGPGVSLSTTLQEGDEDKELLKATFAPSATYTAQDLNQPSVAHASFTTLASGTPTTPKSPYGATSGGSVQKSLVGSAQNPNVRATLTGALNAAGKPTLTAKGKPVSVLKTGRYKLAITDRDAKASFTLEAVHGGAVKDLTTTPFVGKKSVTLVLTPGRWMYYSDRGKASYFLVTN